MQSEPDSLFGTEWQLSYRTASGTSIQCVKSADEFSTVTNNVDVIRSDGLNSAIYSKICCVYLMHFTHMKTF